MTGAAGRRENMTTTLRLAAVQETYVLMDSEATIERVAQLTANAVAPGGPPRSVPRGLCSGHADLDRVEAAITLLGIESRCAQAATILRFRCGDDATRPIVSLTS